MKLTIPQLTEIEAVAIRVAVPVRYDEEDIPKDFPFRKAVPGRGYDVWDVTIDIDTGKIRDWPGPADNVEMKVCDEGSYYLLDKDGKVLASIEHDYVPGCIPSEYGDYIRFDIAEDGTVTDWEDYCTPENVRTKFFRSRDGD